jgi:hypothetical protein
MSWWGDIVNTSFRGQGVQLKKHISLVGRLDPHGRHQGGSAVLLLPERLDLLHRAVLEAVSPSVSSLFWGHQSSYGSLQGSLPLRPPVEAPPPYVPLATCGGLDQLSYYTVKPQKKSCFLARSNDILYPIRLSRLCFRPLFLSHSDVLFSFM